MTRRSNPDDAGPASKRPKLEESDADAVPGSPKPQQPAQDAFEPRHDSLWLRDGSVVIAAIGLSFKVHSSVLERHSTVFRELLDETVDGAVIPAETFEDCKVLRVADKGSALTEFLNILYDSGSRCVDPSFRVSVILKSHGSPFLNRKVAIPFRNLRRITLLAAKYKIQFIINEAIARLETVFPVAYSTTSGRMDTRAYCTPAPGALVLCNPPDCLAAVALARSIDAANPPSFIVTAFYFACSSASGGIFGSDSYDDEPLKLSHADLRTCLKSADKLLLRNKKTNEVLLELQQNQLAKPQACTPGDAKKCRTGFINLVHAAIRQNLFTSKKPLRSCEDFLREHIDEQATRVCTTCAAQIRTKLEESRMETFNKLGEYFGIAPWPPQI